MIDLKSKRILVTGGTGFLGRELCRQLRAMGCEPEVPPRNQFDLLVPWCFQGFRERQPEIVFHLAANCGGIGWNQKFPARLAHDNLQMGLHLLNLCECGDVEKLVIVGTVCSYPKVCPIPFKESDIWNGYPEETNAGYGVAKRALLTLAQCYRQQYGLNTAFIIPTNLYGPGDCFDPARSHAVPAMLARLVEAKRSGAPTVTMWGSGTCTREFLHVSDAARGLILAAEKYDSPEPLNLGSGEELDLRTTADVLRAAVGYSGTILWDKSKPDGQPRRAVDFSRARELIGYEPRIKFGQGALELAEWYAAQKCEAARSHDPH